MSFNPQTALNYAASIARPRRVGSGEDEKVANEIEERLRGWGYQVERQPFAFSTLPNTFLTLVIFSGLFLVTIVLLAHDQALLLADVASIALIVLFIAFMPLNRVVQAKSLRRVPGGWRGAYPDMTRLIKRYATTNLIARLPLPERSDVPHLYLVAHYDSKSQRMPLAVRVTLFMLVISLGLTLAVLTLFNVPSALYLLIGLLALAAGAPLLFLDVGNNSPGAIDNASSVGLVLHLAEMLAQREDGRDKLRLTILIPSAEELTLMGSVAYITEYEKTLRLQAGQGGLFILNFDGIGVDGDLYYVGNSRRRADGDTIALLDHVQHACRELNVPLKRFRFVGALFDHVPFAQHGFDAISLVAIGPAIRAVHTPQDSIDQLHVRGLDQAGRVTLQVIEQLTTDFHGISKQGALF